MAQARMNFSTPQGVAQYPWLNKADTKFDDEGVYKTNLSVDPDSAKALVAKINEFAQEQLGKKMSKAQLPYMTDPDTGDVIFKTKSKFQPKFKDSAGQLIMDSSSTTVGRFCPTSSWHPDCLRQRRQRGRKAQPRCCPDHHTSRDYW